MKTIFLKFIKISSLTTLLSLMILSVSGRLRMTESAVICDLDKNIFFVSKAGSYGPESVTKVKGIKASYSAWRFSYWGPFGVLRYCEK